MMAIKPELRKNVKTDATDAVVEIRERMVSLLCEVCRDTAELESWSTEEISDGVCSPCYNRLQEAGFVD